MCTKKKKKQRVLKIMEYVSRVDKKYTQNLKTIYLSTSDVLIYSLNKEIIFTKIYQLIELSYNMMYNINNGISK
jgi:hypothetical protein